MSPSPRGNGRHSWQWIDSLPSLEACAGALRAAGRIVVDTEANGFHAYRPRLCLIQIGWHEGDEFRTALVDALALDGRLGALAPVFEDPSIEKTLHGADYDVRLLKRDASLALKGIFDTQIGAKLVGEKKTALSALAATIAGFELDKSGQRVDWARRPLPDAALVYADEDVRALVPVREHVAARLEEMGRMRWAREEFRELEAVEPAEPSDPDPHDLLGRIKGAGSLGGRKRAALAEALLWREREARRRDVPAVHVAPPKGLFEAARRGARSTGGLIASGVPAKIVDRHGTSILDALTRGQEGPPLPTRRPGRDDTREPPVDGALLKRLRATRDRHAETLGIEPGLLCPTSSLKAMARERPRTIEDLTAIGLRRWQAEEIGPAVLALLEEAAHF